MATVAHPIVIAILAVCETLNFTRAAEACNVSQPSLTRAIKGLEDELGGPLFRRERNNTHLTGLGEMMRPHLTQVLIETDAAKRKALVVEFQKLTTLEAPNLPLVELESITVASTKVQNHSNDPNYLAASWFDIWLAS